jgi:hypothetical protein
MKNSIYLIALAVFFIFGCNESPNSSPNRVNDPNHPSTNDGPNSITDIPTPEITGHTSGAVDDEFQVCLEWDSNTPLAEEEYSTVPNDDNNFGHDAEYWGTTQDSIVGPGSGGHANQPYSGHYEVYRDGVHIADVTGNGYCDTVAAGTYTYTIKSKSLEGVQPNSMTHHSEMSEGYEVTTCSEVEIPNSYKVRGASGGPGTWSDTIYTMNNRTSNVNMFWNFNQYTRTQNSCTNEITSTQIADYTGNVYIGVVVGATTTWTLVQTWDNVAGAYHVNGTFNAGIGKPGTGPLPSGGGTYTLHYSTTPSMTGYLCSSTLIIP